MKTPCKINRLGRKVVFLLFFLPFILSAQVYDFNFEHISIERCLSQSSISSIVQDERGFLWFGTQDGLNTYDGIWNEQATSLKINIQPPVWNTAWFRIFAILFLLAIAYGIYRLQVKKIEKQKRILQKEVANRTKQLKDRNKDLIKAIKETDNILKNVEEGLFLLNDKCEIASQYSAALEKIFEEKQLANKNFLNIIEKKITTKLMTNVEEYLELMFNDEIDEEVIVELNPLTEIEFDFKKDKQLSSSSKYLSFKFRRVKDSKRTKELIATVVDITDHIKLSKKLEESEARTKKQMEWLLSILHVEVPLLQEFIDGVARELIFIELTLKNGGKTTNFLKILDIIYQSAHIIKGNASLLDLKFFASKAHEFEECIISIKEKEEIKGSDFVPLVLRLEVMRNDLNEIKSLVNRISQIHTHFRPKRRYESHILIRSIQNLINNLSSDLKKKVKLDHQEFDGANIPYHFRLLVKDILVQMVKNSVYHGIENPDERIKLKKPKSGIIKISTFSENGNLKLTFEDDGRGIQLENLLIKAKASGRWPVKEINKWDQKKITNVIFESGISTTNRADFFAGRGMGMNIIMEKIKNNGGEIKIDNSPGEYCKFTILLPLIKEVSIETAEPKTAGGI